MKGESPDSAAKGCVGLRRTRNARAKEGLLLLQFVAIVSFFSPDHREPYHSFRSLPKRGDVATDLRGHKWTARFVIFKFFFSAERERAFDLYHARFFFLKVALQYRTNDGPSLHFAGADTGIFEKSLSPRTVKVSSAQMKP